MSQNTKINLIIFDVIGLTLNSIKKNHEFLIIDVEIRKYLTPKFRINYLH